MQSLILIESVFQERNLVFQVSFLQKPLIVLTEQLIPLGVFGKETLDFVLVVLVSLFESINLLAFTLIFLLKLLQVGAQLGIARTQFSNFDLKVLATSLESISLFLHVFLFHLVQCSLFLQIRPHHVQLRLSLLNISLISTLLFSLSLHSLHLYGFIFVSPFHVPEFFIKLVILGFILFNSLLFT